jgi:DNA-binding NarL/FixJ family response regulator
MPKRDRQQDETLRVLIADDSPDAIAQMSAWLWERWPAADLYTALAPDEAIRIALAQRIENIILDLDFGARRDSGVTVAQKILEARGEGDHPRTRILFRTVHAGDPGYLHQIQKLVTADARLRPAVWGFLDKGSVPKRLAQNTAEQVFVYELSFTEMFSQHLKNSPSRDLSDLEFTVLIYLCLGVTNDGVAWLVGASRQSVERVLGGLYKKLRIPSRRDAPQGVPTLLESRTRLCCEAVTRGLVNPHLLREEDATLHRAVNDRLPAAGRLHVNREWVEEANHRASE